MQTVILAGGEGARLRPLTADTPKPLVKIAGESAAVRLLKNLSASGIRSATLCTHYLADRLSAELGTQRAGVRLRYCKEKTPLGTAGCVRAAWRGGDVLVLSGDGVCGFDYNAVLEFHASTGADVTIVAREVDDPREYGLMTVSEDGRVTGFLEKPGFDDCLTNLANTGAYVVSADVVSRIPEGEKVDFAKDVFPQLLSEGKKIFAYIDRTYWYDVGDIPSLLSCQRDILEREGKSVLVQKGAAVAENAVVSGGSVIERGAAVGKGSRVISSLICEGSCIAADADISEAVICKNVTAGERLIMKPYSAIGRDCVIGSDVTVCEGARIASGSRIPDGAIVRTDVSESGFSSLAFEDDGRASGLSGAQDLLRFGMAAGCALGDEVIFVGGSGGGLEAVCLGLRSVGVAVCLSENACFGESVFCASKLGCEHFIFCCGGEIRLMSVSTLGLSREEERSIAQIYNRSVPLEAPEAAGIADGLALSGLYRRHLKELLPEKPLINAVLKTSDEREAEIFSKIMPRAEGEKAVFTVASDRLTVSAVAGDAVVSYENLLILCCKSYFERRRSVVLQRRSPQCVPQLAKEYRSSALFCDAKRPLSGFACDPHELVFEVVAYVAKRGISLSAAVEELPRVVYMKRIVETPKRLPKIMSEGFGEARAGGEITLENGGARAFVKPMKSGKAVSVYIESVSAEAAGELSRDIAQRIKAALDKEANL